MVQRATYCSYNIVSGVDVRVHVEIKAGGKSEITTDLADTRLPQDGYHPDADPLPKTAASLAEVGPEYHEAASELLWQELSLSSVVRSTILAHDPLNLLGTVKASSPFAASSSMPPPPPPSTALPSSLTSSVSSLLPVPPPSSSALGACVEHVALLPATTGQTETFVKDAAAALARIGATGTIDLASGARLPPRTAEPLRPAAALISASVYRLLLDQGRHQECAALFRKLTDACNQPLFAAFGSGALARAHRPADGLSLLADVLGQWWGRFGRAADGRLAPLSTMQSQTISLAAAATAPAAAATAAAADGTALGAGDDDNGGGGGGGGGAGGDGAWSLPPLQLAVELARQATLACPHNARVWLGLARAYFSVDDHGAALVALNAAPATDVLNSAFVFGGSGGSSGSDGSGDSSGSAANGGDDLLAPRRPQQAAWTVRTSRWLAASWLGRLGPINTLLGRAAGGACDASDAERAVRQASRGNAGDGMSLDWCCSGRESSTRSSSSSSSSGSSRRKRERQRQHRRLLDVEATAQCTYRRTCSLFRHDALDGMYEVLVRIEREIGWERLLELRSDLFFMERNRMDDGDMVGMGGEMDASDDEDYEEEDESAGDDDGGESGVINDEGDEQKASDSAVANHPTAPATPAATGTAKEANATAVSAEAAGIVKEAAQEKQPDMTEEKGVAGSSSSSVKDEGVVQEVDDNALIQSIVADLVDKAIIAADGDVGGDTKEAGGDGNRECPHLQVVCPKPTLNALAPPSPSSGSPHSPSKRELEAKAHENGFDDDDEDDEEEQEQEAEQEQEGEPEEEEESKLPPEWEELFDEQQDHVYYYNSRTQVSQWTRPTQGGTSPHSRQPDDYRDHEQEDRDHDHPLPPEAPPPGYVSYGGGDARRRRRLASPTLDGLFRWMHHDLHLCSGWAAEDATFSAPPPPPAPASVASVASAASAATLAAGEPHGRGTGLLAAEAAASPSAQHGASGGSNEAKGGGGSDEEGEEQARTTPAAGGRETRGASAGFIASFHAILTRTLSDADPGEAVAAAVEAEAVTAATGGDPTGAAATAAPSSAGGGGPAAASSRCLWFRRGLAAQRLGRGDLAEAAFKAAARQTDRKPSPFLSLALLCLLELYVGAGRAGDALMAANRLLLHIDDNDGWAQEKEGYVRAVLGDAAVVAATSFALREAIVAPMFQRRVTSLVGTLATGLGIEAVMAEVEGVSPQMHGGGPHRLLRAAFQQQQQQQQQH